MNVDYLKEDAAYIISLILVDWSFNMPKIHVNWCPFCKSQFIEKLSTDPQSWKCYQCAIIFRVEVKDAASN